MEKDIKLFIQVKLIIIGAGYSRNQSFTFKKYVNIFLEE